MTQPATAPNNAADGSVKDLRAAARAGRKAFDQSPLGPFARTMLQAMRDFAEARKAGVSLEDGIRGIEACLRDSWPGRVSKFQQCSGCDGTGYHERVCDMALRCSRMKCAHAEADWHHTYVTPCDCTLGDKFKGRSTYTGEEQLAAVGRRKKAQPKGWSRAGI